MNKTKVFTPSTALPISVTPKLLTCPVRGPLTAFALAADGLNASEEARRIDLIHLLIDRHYPPANIAVETIVLKNIGANGRNSVRADVVVYSQNAHDLKSLSMSDRLKHAIAVAEVKRDSKSKKSAIDHQLEPALRLLPATDALGIYWDDINQILLIKSLVETGKNHRFRLIKTI
ncbi:hypothetical protein [Novosphingobium sp.]|uniref:hypothetical protein n=1 Tax=Novosphingobium sp. TaxID=1874826 RepID=UPI0025D85620|nr:hypothetical protein [Novosphingobium sp.]